MPIAGASSCLLHARGSASPALNVLISCNPLSCLSFNRLIPSSIRRTAFSNPERFCSPRHQNQRGRRVRLNAARRKPHLRPFFAYRVPERFDLRPLRKARRLNTRHTFEDAKEPHSEMDLSIDAFSTSSPLDLSSLVAHRRCVIARPSRGQPARRPLRTQNLAWAKLPWTWTIRGHRLLRCSDTTVSAFIV